MKNKIDTVTAPSSSKIKFEQSEDSDSPIEESDFSSDDEAAEIENALADIPFEELQKARADGTLSWHPKRGSEIKNKRANKNRPAEFSSKVRVSSFREVVQAPKRVIRDPRFESLCGNFDEAGFKKRYNFIYEESLPAEKTELQKQLKTSNDPKTIQELNDRMSWINKQLKKSESTKRTDAQILAEHKKKEREAAKQGKRPFYLKKSDIRKQTLLEKYNNLKASGKLDSFIQKKRKRNAAKDHRFMPYSRQPNHDS
ncbi:hypothetical protein RND81_06G238100 [Saponaria officinalis]|uniref:rRNA biogenesis protein RRP36 n=1 Tax=Saponaria officinalis TaxID=3572 RepID=A0AAW1KDD3_SAPOF